VGALFVLVAVAFLSGGAAAAAVLDGRRPGRAAAMLAGAAGRPRGGRPRPPERRTLPFPFAYLNRPLAAAGLGIRLPAVLGLTAAGAIVCWAATSVVLGPGWPSVLALAGGFAAPLWWVGRLAEGRRHAVLAELERAAAALEAGVSAGLNLYEALLETGARLGGVVGQELLRVVRDADRVGLSEALMLFAARLPLPEVRLLVAGMRLHQNVGARLAEALGELHATLRERRETALAMQSATAAGRTEAGILVAVPPVLLAAMRLFSPAFEAPLFATPTGHAVLLGSGLWLAVGYGVVRRMVVPKEVA
jgi:Flp pilus assembly protein TadB